MKTYRTKQGQMLDQIALEQYGPATAGVEAILEANPGLAEHGPVLPSGLILRIPAIEQPANEQEVQLWQ